MEEGLISEEDLVYRGILDEETSPSRDQPSLCPSGVSNGPYRCLSAPTTSRLVGTGPVWAPVMCYRDRFPPSTGPREKTSIQKKGPHPLGLRLKMRTLLPSRKG